MRTIGTAKLREMQVVNICNGQILGYPGEFELCIDACATLTAIIIKGSKGIFGIGKKEDTVIPWNCVQCIGEDAILVNVREVPEYDCRTCKM